MKVREKIEAAAKLPPQKHNFQMKVSLKLVFLKYDETNYGSRPPAINPQDKFFLIINWQKLMAQLKNEDSLFGEMAIFFARMLSE